MKKILLFFAAAVCAVASWAADVEATVSATVKSQTLEVALKNDSEDFVAFQMDITLPEGVTGVSAVALVADRLTSSEETITINGEKASLSFNIAYNQIDATHVRVIAYNLENRAIAGKAGALFNVTFAGTPAANFELTNVKFVTVSALEEVDLDAVQSELGEEVLLGDVNRDGFVDVGDIAAIVIIIQNGDVSTFNLDAANVNGDDAIDVGDIAGLVTLIQK